MSLKATTDAFLAEVLADEPIYPNGTVFIDVESKAYARSIVDAMYERRPFVLVFPAGQRRLYAPASNTRQRLVARVLWPLVHKALLGEIEDIEKSIRKRRSKPHKAAPQRIRRGHYALSPKRAHQHVA